MINVAQEEKQFLHSILYIVYVAREQLISIVPSCSALRYAQIYMLHKNIINYFRFKEIIKTKLLYMTQRRKQKIEMKCFAIVLRKNMSSRYEHSHK